jgi:predicted MPP superfamily phosphohydrolase
MITPRDSLFIFQGGKANALIFALLACILLAWATAWAKDDADGCRVSNPSSPKGDSSRTASFLFFSDLHFNPLADAALAPSLVKAMPEEWGAILALSKAGFPSYGVDSPNELLQSALDDMVKRIPSPDFILIGGDILCHRIWGHYADLTGDASKEGVANFIAKTMEYVVAETARRFPNTGIYLAPGNNDSALGDYAVEVDDPFLVMSAPTISRVWLKNETARAAFLRDYPHTGSYSVLLPEAGGLRLLVLNDVFWSKRHKDATANANLHAWLENELAAAREKKEHVWLLSHIPPGSNARSSAVRLVKTGALVYEPLLKDEDNRALISTLKNYASTIKTVLTGHTHRDEFRLLFASPSLTEPVIGLRTAPSISPITGNNPGYQVYSYDPNNHTLLDETTYFLDIEKGSKSWEVEYEYSKAYGQGLDSMARWNETYNGLLSCPAWRKAYGDFHDVSVASRDEMANGAFAAFWMSIGRTVPATFTMDTAPPECR